MEENKTPTVWASIGTTIEVSKTPYQNYKIDIGLSGIPVDASEELRQKYIDQGKKTIYEVLMSLGEELGNRIQDLK